MLALVWLCWTITGLQAQPFTNVTAAAGINHTHSNSAQQIRETLQIAGGGAAGDIDNDGDIDLFLVGGGVTGSAFLRNNGDGTFSDISAAVGISLFDIHNSGPVFADVNNDGWQDLIVLSVNQITTPPEDDDVLENRPRVFINQQDDSFSEHPDSGFTSGMPSFGAALGDLDRDGDLDMFISHWSSNHDGFQYFWLNDGNGHFTDITIAALGGQIASLDRFSFTPNITDINNDGWPDVLLASDFGTSRLFISNGMDAGQLTFTVEKPPVLTDENGMGAAVADYDNDGDLDWFVSSIRDPDCIDDPDCETEGNWGGTGNRLYRNTGNGVFEDATDEAGVRHGWWGWGSCFADFNNDGWLDLYHENGFSGNQAVQFYEDPARLFMANGDGTFSDQAQSSGLDFTGQGRGIVCFDYDLDGDLDVLVIPNNDSVQLYRNDLDNDNNYLQVSLQHVNPTLATGAQITLESSTGEQLREVTVGSNYVSNNPLLQHFGVPAGVSIDALVVNWPTGTSSRFDRFSGLTDITANQSVAIAPNCMTRWQSFTPANQQAALTVQLIDQTGDPLTDHPLQLTVHSGPSGALQLNSQTNAAGIAEFTLQYPAFGVDRLRYSFSFDAQPQQCEALLSWGEAAMFENGFERP